MDRARQFPETESGPFPIPPSSFTDGAGRTIELADGKTAGSTEDVLNSVIDMYDQFDPVDRAQGIPPTGRDRLRTWLEPLVEDGINVLARHDGAVVGHATLVSELPDGDYAENADTTAWELAIFVLQEYQQAGIGTQLLEHLLGYAADHGIREVWLTVERWNKPAIALYERVGFESTKSERFEQEMVIRLATHTESTG